MSFSELLPVSGRVSFIFCLWAESKLKGFLECLKLSKWLNFLMSLNACLNQPPLEAYFPWTSAPVTRPELPGREIGVLRDSV